MVGASGVARRRSRPECCALLASLAVRALEDEALLTPKPGLVDQDGRGAHSDMDIRLMLRSAETLREPFAQMADAAFRLPVGQTLREELADIGRRGERAMLSCTGGVNTHRGAIWALGLLVAGAAACGEDAAAEQIAAAAGAIARYPDRFQPRQATNGAGVRRRYGAPGAREEAQHGFPHVTEIGLPALAAARCSGISDRFAKLDALLAIMSRLSDTCLLHRGGRSGLRLAQRGAARVLACGGSSTEEGWLCLRRLNHTLTERRLSPGGAADMLAATLFVDLLTGGGASA